MDSVTVENKAASNNNVDIGPEDLFKAAADGNTEPFKKTTEKLNQVVTPIKNTVLHINIISEKASAKFVEEILEMFPSLLLQVNAQGDTPLHVALKFKRGDVVEALINRARAQHDEDVENEIGALRQMLRMANHKGNTALHEAMRNHSIYVVEIFAKDVEIFAKDDLDFPYSANHCGETPLYIAAETGFLEGAVKMLETNPSVAHEGPNGKTALHAAARMNSQDLIREILGKKKNLTKEKDDNGWTPLHCAAYHGLSEATRPLLEFDKSTAYIADKFRQMTPLHLAAARGHIDVMKEILLHCPDCCELVDNRGWNFVHFAMATVTREKESLKLAENPLIKNLVNEKDAKGNTPLHVLAAVNSDYLCLVSNFIEKVGGKLEAFNKENVSVSNIFDYGSPELKKEILELSDVKDGPYHLGVINRQDNNYLDRMVSKVEKMTESHLLVCALVATVTFAAAFTLPGGFKNEEGPNKGTAILSRNSAFQAFVITNAIAMVLSITAVFIHFLSALDLKNYLAIWPYAAYCSAAAIPAVVVAFVTGMYAVLSPSLGLAIVTCFIGLTFFLSMYFVFYKVGKNQVE